MGRRARGLLCVRKRGGTLAQAGGLRRAALQCPTLALLIRTPTRVSAIPVAAVSQSFCQYRGKVQSMSPEEIENLKKCDKVCGSWQGAGGPEEGGRQGGGAG